MGEIVLKGYQCERCSHKWVYRGGGGVTIPKYAQSANRHIGISLERLKRRNTTLVSRIKRI
jgi:hypothetical protein